MTFTAWRRVHLFSSGLVGVIALAHCAVTFVFYKEWSQNAVWFFGTGVGLLSIAVMNIAHVGLEPCRQPTAPVIRLLDCLFVGLGLAAVVAVPEPQAYLVVVGLIGQAVASFVTLPGPSNVERAVPSGERIG
jgi:hypothetical protein